MNLLYLITSLLALSQVQTASADVGREPDGWHDPELLNALARSAQRVTLIEGSVVQLTLKP